MRQLISDTATAMFLERGFESVRVAEVAAACEVSEKTVYNYFPTKESLIFDREEAMSEDIRRVLGPGGAPISPIDAAVELIAAETGSFFDSWPEGDDPPVDLTLVRRFSELLERTPSLRAARRDMADRLVEVAARAMAARAGVDPDDPEPQIAADALLGLWRVQFRAMTKYSDGTRPRGRGTRPGARRGAPGGPAHRHRSLVVRLGRAGEQRPRAAKGGRRGRPRSQQTGGNRHQTSP